MTSLTTPLWRLSLTLLWCHLPLYYDVTNEPFYYDLTSLTPLLLLVLPQWRLILFFFILDIASMTTRQTMRMRSHLAGISALSISPQRVERLTLLWCHLPLYYYDVTNEPFYYDLTSLTPLLLLVPPEWRLILFFFTGHSKYDNASDDDDDVAPGGYIRTTKGGKTTKTISKINPKSGKRSGKSGKSGKR